MTFEAAAEPEPQVQKIHVLRSRNQYLLIANRVVGSTLPNWVPVTPQAVAVPRPGLRVRPGDPAADLDL